MEINGGFLAAKSDGYVECFGDVWRSEDDGATWSLVSDTVPWTGRYQHAMEINGDDEIFILGGIDVNLNRCGDTWRSMDGGQNWQVVTPAAPWAARYEHASVADRNGSLYVIGGMSTSESKFRDVWQSQRTCEDDVNCPGHEPVCRDGMENNFQGLSQPVCVGICDHRIFDECVHKEACHVHMGKATCIDPCHHQECMKGEVCEVAPRGEEFQSEILSDAQAYCLACDDSKTKFACDKLKQCTWDPSGETCQMLCKVLKVESDCNELSYCKWGDDACTNN